MLCGKKCRCRFEIAAAGFLQDQQALIYPGSANSRGTSEIAIGYPGSPGVGKRQHYYDRTTHFNDFCISEKLYLTGATAELRGRKFKRQPETVDLQGF
jgi:hypothetical protein